MKPLSTALCLLCLAPVAARAEAGAQLTAWAASSPRPAHEGDPQPAAPAGPAAQPLVDAKVEATPEKKVETQTVTATTTPEQLAAMSGLTVNASFDTYLGQGTFFDPSLYASLASAFGVSARYSFSIRDVKLAVSGGAYISYEYTLPDSPNGRRWSWRDLGVGFSAPAVFKDRWLTGVNVTPSIGLSVPITLESLHATLITALSANLSFTRTIGRFDFSLVVSGSHGFFRNPYNETNASTQTDAVGNLQAIGRPGELGAAYSNTNTEWGQGTAVSVDFRATDTFSFYVSYAFRMGWRFNTIASNDPYTSKAVNSDGAPVAQTGYVRSPDLAITSIGANYQFSDHWGVSVYTYTAMPPLFNDGRSLRFPFWDFTAGPMNYSALGVSLSASF